MMKISCLASILMAIAALTGCKVEVGKGNFDGSVFNDDGGAKRDAGHPLADAGKPQADAGKHHDEDGGDEEDGGGAATAHPDGGQNGSTPGKDAGSSELGASDVPASFAKAVCAALESCLGTALLHDFLNGTPCLDLLTHQQTERGLNGLSDSIAAGRVLFRPARFEDCQAALAAYGCDAQSRRLPASCEDALEGQVAMRGACSIDYDCAGDAFCDKGLDTETCPGSCAPLQAEGLPCKASNECEDHLICPSNTKKCTALLKEGDGCDSATCPPGLVCLGNSGARKCQTKGAYSGKLDDACDALLGPLCQPGLACESQSTQNTSGTCKMPVAKDAACKRAQPEECPDTQYCKVAQSGSIDRPQMGEAGVCANVPSDGDSCSGSTSIPCGPGAVCSPMSKVCRTLKPAGGACEDKAECYSSSCESGSCTLELTCKL